MPILQRGILRLMQVEQITQFHISGSKPRKCDCRVHALNDYVNCLLLVGFIEEKGKTLRRKWEVGENVISLVGFSFFFFLISDCFVVL